MQLKDQRSIGRRRQQEQGRPTDDIVVGQASSEKALPNSIVPSGLHCVRIFLILFMNSKFTEKNKKIFLIVY